MDGRRVSRTRCAGRTVSESVTPRWLCRHSRHWCCEADLYRETPAAAVEPATTTTTESTARPPSSPSLTSDRTTAPIACDAPVSSARPAGSEALPPIVFYDVQGGTATNTLYHPLPGGIASLLSRESLSVQRLPVFPRAEFYTALVGGVA